MFIGPLLGPGPSAKKLTLVLCPQLRTQLPGEIAKTLMPESCFPRYSVLLHLAYSLDTGIFFKAPQVTAVESQGGEHCFLCLVSSNASISSLKVVTMGRHAHFADGKADAQRRSIACPRPHGEEVVESKFSTETA